MDHCSADTRRPLPTTIASPSPEACRTARATWILTIEARGAVRGSGWNAFTGRVETRIERARRPARHEGRAIKSVSRACRVHASGDGEAIVVGKGRRVSAEQWSNHVHMCKANVFRPWAALPARAGGRAPLRCVSAHRAVGYAQHFGGLTACSLCPLSNTSLTLREIVSVTCYTTPGMCPDPQVAPFSTCGAAYSLTNSRAYGVPRRLSPR